MSYNFTIWSEFPKYSDPVRDDDGSILEGESVLQDFDGDPYGYVVELNGEDIAEYGDHYHDKGQDKAEGFVHGYLYAFGFGEDDHIVSIRYDSRVNEDKHGDGW